MSRGKQESAPLTLGQALAAQVRIIDIQVGAGAEHPAMSLTEVTFLSCVTIGDVEDIFNIPGFERDLVKRVFYILINAPSLRSALSAVADGERPKRKGTYATA